MCSSDLAKRPATTEIYTLSLHDALPTWNHTPVPCWGLPGPNGAAKTATVRILSTLLRPDAGRARVAVLSYRHTTAS